MLDYTNTTLELLNEVPSAASARYGTGWKICSDSYDEYRGFLTVRYVNLTDDKMKEKKF